MFTFYTCFLWVCCTLSVAATNIILSDENAPHKSPGQRAAEHLIKVLKAFGLKTSSLESKLLLQSAPKSVSSGQSSSGQHSAAAPVAAPVSPVTTAAVTSPGGTTRGGEDAHAAAKSGATLPQRKGKGNSTSGALRRRRAPTWSFLDGLKLTYGDSRVVGDMYAVYRITCTTTRGHRWDVWHRMSDFVKLRSALLKVKNTSDEDMPQLPFSYRRSFDQSHLIKRRHKVQELMEFIMEDGVLRQREEVRDFLSPAKQAEAFIAMGVTPAIPNMTPMTSVERPASPPRRPSSVRTTAAAIAASGASITSSATTATTTAAIASVASAASAATSSVSALAQSAFAGLGKAAGSMSPVKTKESERLAAAGGSGGVIGGAGEDAVRADISVGRNRGSSLAIGDSNVRKDKEREDMSHSFHAGSLQGGGSGRVRDRDPVDAQGQQHTRTLKSGGSSNILRPSVDQGSTGPSLNSSAGNHSQSSSSIPVSVPSGGGQGTKSSKTSSNMHMNNVKDVSSSAWSSARKLASKVSVPKGTTVSSSMSKVVSSASANMNVPKATISKGMSKLSGRSGKRDSVSGQSEGGEGQGQGGYSSHMSSIGGALMHRKKLFNKRGSTSSTTSSTQGQYPGSAPLQGGAADVEELFEEDAVEDDDGPPVELVKGVEDANATQTCCVGAVAMWPLVYCEVFELAATSVPPPPLSPPSSLSSPTTTAASSAVESPHSPPPVNAAAHRCSHAAADLAVRPHLHRRLWEERRGTPFIFLVNLQLPSLPGKGAGMPGQPAVNMVAAWEIQLEEFAPESNADVRGFFNSFYRFVDHASCRISADKQSREASRPTGGSDGGSSNGGDGGSGGGGGGDGSGAGERPLAKFGSIRLPPNQTELPETPARLSSQGHIGVFSDSETDDEEESEGSGGEEDGERAGAAGGDGAVAPDGGGKDVDADEEEEEDIMPSSGGAAGANEGGASVSGSRAGGAGSSSLSVVLHLKDGCSDCSEDVRHLFPDGSGAVVGVKLEESMLAYYVDDGYLEVDVNVHDEKGRRVAELLRRESAALDMEVALILGAGDDQEGTLLGVARLNHFDLRTLGPLQMLGRR